MPSSITISAEKLNRFIGTPNGPSLIDVRTNDEWAAVLLLIPGAQRRLHKDRSEWAAEFIGRPAVAICQNGAQLGLTTDPLLRLASIVGAADMDRIDAAPQAAGLVAASLGLSRMFSDDLAEPEAGLVDCVSQSEGI